MVSPQATQPGNTPHPRPTGSVRITAQRAAIQTFLIDELQRARIIAASERNDRNVLFAGQPTPDRMLSAERRVIAANAVEQHMAGLAAAYGVKVDNHDFPAVS
jgi:hypothetical protein